MSHDSPTRAIQALDTHATKTSFFDFGKIFIL
jgi:hypothetical protein